MKQWARSFYSGTAWQKCREAYKRAKGGLCEVCLAKGIYSAGEIVHHKTELTPENIHNPNITLSWSNLQLVCRECHAKIHDLGSKRRYKIDEYGRVIGKT